jgi:hypothetical protein
MSVIKILPDGSVCGTEPSAAVHVFACKVDMRRGYFDLVWDIYKTNFGAVRTLCYGFWNPYPVDKNEAEDKNGERTRVCGIALLNKSNEEQVDLIAGIKKSFYEMLKISLSSFSIPYTNSRNARKEIFDVLNNEFDEKFIAPSEDHPYGSWSNDNDMVIANDYVSEIVHGLYMRG